MGSEPEQEEQEEQEEEEELQEPVPLPTQKLGPDENFTIKETVVAVKSHPSKDNPNETVKETIQGP